MSIQTRHLKQGLRLILSAIFLFTSFFSPTAQASIEIMLPNEISSELSSSALLVRMISYSDSFKAEHSSEAKEKIILQMESSTEAAIRIFGEKGNQETKALMAQAIVESARVLRLGLGDSESQIRISSEKGLEKIGQSFLAVLEVTHGEKLSDKTLAILSLLSTTHSDLCRRFKQARAIQTWGKIVSVLSKEIFSRKGESKDLFYAQEQMVASISVSVLELKNHLMRLKNEASATSAIQQLERLMPVIENLAAHRREGLPVSFVNSLMSWPVKKTETALLRFTTNETNSQLRNQANRVLTLVRRASTHF